jgi:hypothetical protein
MNQYLRFTILLLIILSLIGCKKDESNPATIQTQSIIATETWNAVMDNDSANHGQHTFDKKSDGTVTTTGTWYYSNQGTEVQCPFIEGAVTIADTVVTFTAQGTATNPAAPSGYRTSPFTFSTNSVAYNDKAYGNYTISFSTLGWPAKLQGTFTSKQTSGSGITK